MANLWLVVTHADDLVDDQMEQGEWIRGSRTNAKFDEVVRMVGAERILFIENKTARNPREDEFCAVRRETAKALLLDVMKNSRPQRFTIETIEAAQRQYDEKVAAAEAQRKAELERLEQEKIKAATELERARANHQI